MCWYVTSSLSIYSFLYGATRASPKSFYNHHMQRLVKDAVVGDAKNTRTQVNCHRQWLHHWAAA